MITFLTFYMFTKAIDDKVCPEYGLVTETLNTNDFVITHGSKKLNIDIKLRYPKYDVANEGTP